LNIFLFINRYLVFFLAIFLTFFFLIIIFYKQINISNVVSKNLEQKLTNIDISEPKFAINNKSKKIYISAKEGNFLNKDEILLNKNVKFKSIDFSIETERVIFNRDKQTAKSKTKSLFKSKNTIISSEGFNIYDKGNKIIFYGSSFVILK
tara:strand:+ start:566 stop:1015 length:450 start_codon:yes stop_codon:yes gene_type:complete